MTDQAPPDFDWVTARATCTGDHAFETLRLLAKQNVETRNAQIAGTAGFEGSDRAFKVWSLVGTERLAVEFHLKRGSVEVRRSNGDILAVTPELGDDGVCRFRVGGEVALDPWQVLRRLLEKVLFLE